MSALAYIATGTAGTRFAGVKLRIVAQRIQAHPEVEKLKTVVQIPGIPEDPIAESFLTPLELEAGRMGVERCLILLLVSEIFKDRTPRAKSRRGFPARPRSGERGLILSGSETQLRLSLTAETQTPPAQENPMIRFSNPEFKIVWRQWFVGVNFCRLSAGRIRFAQAFLGPMQFTVCF